LYSGPPDICAAGTDYQEIAISGAFEDFRVLPGFRPDEIRKQSPACTPIVQLYYRKAFPLHFGAFYSLIAERIEELLEG
jgi:hypothetical protein